jgi:EmrB/QacA subfamily drug resistance transporter
MKKWLRFFSLIPASGLIFLDQTILPVALPTIQKEMGASTVALQWCVNSYLLALAVLILVGGKLSDRIGHRKTYILGLSLFGLSSAFCGISPDIGWLIVSRGFQGAGAAILLPSMLALLASIFPPTQRGRSMGLYASVGSLFMIFGPLVGGFFTQVLSWRWIFWINLPICAIGIWMVLAQISPTKSLKQKIDGKGFSYFVLAVFLFVFYVMEAPVRGWLSSELLVCLAISVLLSILLWKHEKKSAHPFLDLSLFKHPTYLATNISVAATQFILMGTVYWAIYFQTALHYSPIEAGKLTVFSCLPVLFMAPVAGILADKFTTKLPLALGFFLMIVGLFWIAAFSDASFGILIIGLLTFGAGIPFILTPSFSAAISSVPPTKIGIASGQLSSSRFLACTLGIAGIGSLFIWTTERVLQKSLLLHGYNAAALVGRSHRADASNIIDSFDPGRAELLSQLLVQARIEGFSDLNLIMAGLVLLAFTAVFVVYLRKPSHHLPESPAEGWD